MDHQFKLRPGERPTLRTVARLSQLAVSTVSRALNDAPDINEKTKSKVRAVAKAINYRPVRSSVNLRTGKSYNLALVIDHADEHLEFARRLIVGITTQIKDSRYELFISPQYHDRDPVSQIRMIVESGAADGIILTHTLPQDDRVKYLLEIGFPFVTHGQTELATPHPFYDFDNRKFTFIATRRLIELGCNSVGLVAATGQITSYAHSVNGIGAALEQAGLPPAEFIFVPETDGDVAEVHDFVTRKARAGEVPQGVVCASELATLAVMDALQNENLVIGKDVRIVARKTSNVLTYARPKVDVVLEDLKQGGHTMADLLLRYIAGENARDLQVLIEPEPCWDKTPDIINNAC
ncbi:MAG: substrate-binding domain-containing protein [Alphaproteobacteria bacterium]|nr:substrate-binding domain-containing protein [Alphaproteobacteria bacterium]